MHRSNLTVRTSCTTEKLLFDTNRDNSSGPPVAIGVQYSKTRKEAVGADAPTRVGLKQGGELILSAGAINSPHLLQLSGVGPAELLRQNGVEPLIDAPEVGANLHDHLQIRSVFRLKEGTQSLNTLANSLFGKIAMGLEYLLFQSGPLSMAPSQLGMFVRSDPECVATPDLQFHVQPLSLDSFNEPLHPFPGITASVRCVPTWQPARMQCVGMMVVALAGLGVQLAPNVTWNGGTLWANHSLQTNH
eukprot:INCI14783.12.p1 GENE.INCI14783.12~~INCI14783.12.p1  ORF type:complete len:246 (-),score=23.46 INCI14783.12:429-1166(-)